MCLPTESLDRLIDCLTGHAALTSNDGDAIDRVRAGASRATDVSPLRQHPDVVRFRRELQDGLVRVDTANRVLRLLGQVVAGLSA
jgi:hypothetical protein